jgi:hypothetical protein
MNAEFMRKRQMNLGLIMMPSFINVAKPFDVFHDRKKTVVVTFLLRAKADSRYMQCWSLLQKFASWSKKLSSRNLIRLELYGATWEDFTD